MRLVVRKQFIGKLNVRMQLFRCEQPWPIERTNPVANFFRIETCVCPIVAVVSSFEFGQRSSSIDQRIVGTVVFIDDQASIEYERTLIDCDKGIVVHLFVVETEESLEKISANSHCSMMRRTYGAFQGQILVGVFSIFHSKKDVLNGLTQI